MVPETTKPHDMSFLFKFHGTLGHVEGLVQILMVLDAVYAVVGPIGLLEPLALSPFANYSS